VGDQGGEEPMTATVHYPETGHDWCAQVEDSSWWFQHRNRLLMEIMRRFPPATPLYDVGGGNGVVSAALEQAGIPCVVVEPGSAGARRARARGLRVIEAPLEDAGLEPGSAGAVGLFDVVEHMADGVGFLRKVHGVLRDGGSVYVSVPAYRLLWSAEDEYAQHHERYTDGRLRQTLQAAGFTVEMSTYVFSLLPLPILLARSLPYRLGLTRPSSAEAVSADHSAGGGLTKAALDRLLDLELGMIRRGRRLAFGASVIAVARK
jgi:SAM-dependent methyltransferase